MNIEPITDPYERFLRTLLFLGAMDGMTAQATQRMEQAQPKQPASPYVDNPGQRPGESFTAYRIRVRKEGKA